MNILNILLKKRLCALYVLMVLTQVTYAQDKPLDNGFHLLFQSTSSKDLITCYGFEIGNTWNVYTADAVGLALGLRVTWLDANMGIKDDPAQLRTGTIFGSALGVGPVVTYKVMDKLGVGAFYRVKPTVYYSEHFTTDDSSNFPSTTVTGIGGTGALGLFARYDIFMVGLELGGGTINTVASTSGENDSFDVDTKTSMKYTRLQVGFRF